MVKHWIKPSKQNCTVHDHWMSSYSIENMQWIMQLFFINRFSNAGFPFFLLYFIKINNNVHNFTKLKLPIYNHKWQIFIVFYCVTNFMTTSFYFKRDLNWKRFDFPNVKTWNGSGYFTSEKKKGEIQLTIIRPRLCAVIKMIF